MCRPRLVGYWDSDVGSGYDEEIFETCGWYCSKVVDWCPVKNEGWCADCQEWTSLPEPDICRDEYEPDYDFAWG